MSSGSARVYNPSRTYSSGGTTRVYRSSSRPPSGWTQARPRTSYAYFVPGRVPRAGTAPRPLGPPASAPTLDTPPPRAPFRRLVQPYPYAAQKPGWVADPWEPDLNYDRRVAARISAEGSYQYRGLYRTGLAARFGSARLDVDTQLSFYYEPRVHDGMYLGDTSLNFAPVALPNVVWRVGLGARYMADARLPGQGKREYAAGWNFTSSIDVFPGKPFILSARVDRGMLYRTPVWRGRATVGINHKNVELYVGYDHTQVRHVALGGPAIGLRLWL